MARPSIPMCYLALGVLLYTAVHYEQTSIWWTALNGQLGIYSVFKHHQSHIIFKNEYPDLVSIEFVQMWVNEMWLRNVNMSFQLRMNEQIKKRIDSHYKWELLDALQAWWLIIFETRFLNMVHFAVWYLTLDYSTYHMSEYSIFQFLKINILLVLIYNDYGYSTFNLIIEYSLIINMNFALKSESNF